MKLLLLILGVTLLTIIVHPLSSRAQSVDDQTQDQTQTPIKHVIYLMQENHSFDNYFGTYPGADGIPEGTCMPTVPSDKNSACIAAFAIGGMGITDLGHSRAVFLEQLNHGRMNGFVAAHNKRNGEGRMAMGYYTGDDIPYYWNLADEYVLFDRFFTSALGGSVWNHNFWVSATPGSDEDSIPENGYGEEFITIFDRLVWHE